MTDKILESYERLTKYLGLNVTDIEGEMTRTPRILQEAGELAAGADQTVLFCKHNVELAEAAAAMRIREVPVNGKEPSQARIDSMVPGDPEVVAAKTALRVAIYEADVCTKLHRTFESQARLLSKVSELHASGYFMPMSPAQHDQRRAEMREAHVERKRSEMAERYATGKRPQGGAVARPVR